MIKLYDRENLLKEYYDNHAVEFSMNNTYTLSCDTLDRAQGTQMVVLMHHVSAKGRHMNYQDYKYRDAVQGALGSASEQNEQQHTRYLAVLERSDTEAPLLQKSRRILDDAYKWALTTLSSKQDLLAIPRFSCKESIS